MATSYDEYPGFVGREGQKYSDEIERCEAEKRRAAGEGREPNYSNDWLDLCDGNLSWVDYQSMHPEAGTDEEPKTTAESVFKTLGGTTNE